MYGHKEDVCKKKSMPRKEWRIKQKEHITEHGTSLQQMPIPEVTCTIDNQNAENLQGIARGATLVARTQSVPASIRNKFQSLAVERVEPDIDTHQFPLSPHG